MVVRSLDLNGDPFHLKEDDKQVVLMYYIWMPWLSSQSTKRCWSTVKHIFRDLHGIIDYANAGYLSDTHKACSQIEYVFTSNGKVIS